MPELPEVETVVRQLCPLLQEEKIRSVLVYDKKLKHSFMAKLPGAKIENVRRKGKYIVLCLKNANKKNFFLVFHLRMTGRLQISGLKEGEKKHLRLQLLLQKKKLQFVDLRRFGTVEFFDSWEEIPCRGLDPTLEEFTLDTFSSLVSSVRQATKIWLMRQDKLLGVGNIYASEILFAAGVSPFKFCSKLKEKEIKEIYFQTKKILALAIKNCGTTFSDFQDAHGLTGKYQKFLKVYDREKERCRKCNSLIKRVKQGGRSTFYCSKCQKK